MLLYLLPSRLDNPTEGALSYYGMARNMDFIEEFKTVRS